MIAAKLSLGCDEEENKINRFSRARNKCFKYFILLLMVLQFDLLPTFYATNMTWTHL